MARAVRIASGMALVALGVAMLVLPGPGLVAIAGGLVLLRNDVPAAQRLLSWLGERLPRGWLPHPGGLVPVDVHAGR